MQTLRYFDLKTKRLAATFKINNSLLVLYSNMPTNITSDKFLALTKEEFIVLYSA